MPRRPRSTAIPRCIRRPRSYHGNVNTVGPRSCYDEGKRFAETLVTDFGRRHGLVTRIARIFNTYGPRMQPDDGRVVSNFIVQALLGRDITDLRLRRADAFVLLRQRPYRRVCPADGQRRRRRSLRSISATRSKPLSANSPDVIVDIVGSRSKVVYQVRCRSTIPRRRRPDIAQVRGPRSAGRRRSSSPSGLRRDHRLLRQQLASPLDRRTPSDRCLPIELPAAHRPGRSGRHASNGRLA